MLYLFHDRCYSTLEALAEAVASSCQVISGGQIFRCAIANDPQNVRVQILDFNGGILSQRTFSPAQIDCNPSLIPMTELLWLSAGLLVAGFAIRAIARVIRNK